MDRIVELNNYEEHNNFINSNPSCVIFFGSQNCGHCKNMVIPFEDLAEKYSNVGFAHVEVNKTPTIGTDNGVPIFVGYKNKQPFDQILGANNNALSTMVSKL